jgi:hypothetical protein
MTDRSYIVAQMMDERWAVLECISGGSCRTIAITKRQPDANLIAKALGSEESGRQRRSGVLFEGTLDRSRLMQDWYEQAQP